MMRETELARGRLRLGVGDPDEGTVGASAVTSSGQVTATSAAMTSGGVSTRRCINVLSTDKEI